MSEKIKELEEFSVYLRYEEKSKATQETYFRDIKNFYRYVGVRPITKEEVISYKEHLKEKYAPASVNSMLVALNCFLKFTCRQDCCVKLLKIQKQIFCSEEKELSKDEYLSLIHI